MSRTSGLFLLFALVSSHADAQQSSGTSPVALPAGVAYARLPDTDFETVRALSGQDLFSQVKTRESRGDFVVFVSQRLWADGGDGARVYASVGTALRDAGSVLYLGGSVGVSRALVTAGLSTRLVEEGVGPVPRSGLPRVGRSYLVRGSPAGARVGILRGDHVWPYPMNERRIPPRQRTFIVTDVCRSR